MEAIAWAIVFATCSWHLKHFDDATAAMLFWYLSIIMIAIQTVKALVT